MIPDTDVWVGIDPAAPDGRVCLAVEAECGCPVDLEMTWQGALDMGFALLALGSQAAGRAGVTPDAIAAAGIEAAHAAANPPGPRR